jgi:hypothetical protein
LHIETVCINGFAKANQEFQTKEGSFLSVPTLAFEQLPGCGWKW